MMDSGDSNIKLNRLSQIHTLVNKYIKQKTIKRQPFQQIACRLSSIIQQNTHRYYTDYLLSKFQPGTVCITILHILIKQLLSFGKQTNSYSSSIMTCILTPLKQVAITIAPTNPLSSNYESSPPITNGYYLRLRKRPFYKQQLILVYLIEHCLKARSSQQLKCQQKNQQLKCQQKNQQLKCQQKNQQLKHQQKNQQLKDQQTQSLIPIKDRNERKQQYFLQRLAVLIEKALARRRKINSSSSRKQTNLSITKSYRGFPFKQPQRILNLMRGSKVKQDCCSHWSEEDKQALEILVQQVIEDKFNDMHSLVKWIGGILSQQIQIQQAIYDQTIIGLQIRQTNNEQSGSSVPEQSSKISKKNIQQLQIGQKQFSQMHHQVNIMYQATHKSDLLLLYKRITITLTGQQILTIIQTNSEQQVYFALHPNNNLCPKDNLNQQDNLCPKDNLYHSDALSLNSNPKLNLSQNHNCNSNKFYPNSNNYLKDSSDINLNSPEPTKYKTNINSIHSTASKLNQILSRTHHQDPIQSQNQDEYLQNNQDKQMNPNNKSIIVKDDEFYRITGMISGGRSMCSSLQDQNLTIIKTNQFIDPSTQNLPYNRSTVLQQTVDRNQNQYLRVKNSNNLTRQYLKQPQNQIYTRSSSLQNVSCSLMFTSLDLFNKK